MRRFALLFCALSLGAALAPSLAPSPAHAQSTRQDREEAQRRKAERAKAEKEKQRKEDDRGPAPLATRRAEGPCPYVKVLYDAARQVTFKDNRESASAVTYAGEIEGVTSDCAYKADQPIKVSMNVLFSLGRGPQGEEPVNTFRYWVAVTERNKTVLAKEYFDLPVDFRLARGGDRLSVSQDLQNIVIPRAAATVSGSNFEILVGFDVTPEQAAFNRAGKRFRVNAGQTPQIQTQIQTQTQAPPAQGAAGSTPAKP